MLKNDPTVRMQTPDGHRAENFTIRGFSVNSSDLSYNGMFGLVPGSHVPTELVERVEVLRGPTSVMTGFSPSGAVGGVINLVPKRATAEPITKFIGDYSAKSPNGGSADVSRRFGDSDEYGLRVNLGYHNGDTFTSDMTRLERVLGINADYQGDRFRVWVDTFATDQNQSGGSPAMVYFETLGKVTRAPDGDTNLFPNTHMKSRTRTGVIRSEFDINDNWTLVAAVGASKYDWHGLSVNGTRVVVLNEDGTARGGTYGQKGYTHDMTYELGTRGNFSTWGVDHELVLSTSLVSRHTANAVVQRSSSGVTNLYDPSDLPLAASAGSAEKTGDDTFTSVGVTDTLSFFDDMVQLTGGLRWQHMRSKSYSASAPGERTSLFDEYEVSPTYALVIKPLPNLSFYANYIEGLSEGATPNVNYTNYNEPLSPYITYQSETGVKWDLGTFSNTLSFYRIVKASEVAQNNADGTQTLVTGGKQKHLGIEFTTFGEVYEGVRVLGGFSYIRAKYVKMSDASDGSSRDGNTVPGVPKWNGNLNLEWDIPWVPGFTVTGRTIYTSSQYINTDNTLKIKNWTRFDVGARYQQKIQDRTLTLRANVENVGNHQYWQGYTGNDGYTTMGAPRIFKLSLALDL